ncbi:ATP-binding protein, partial [Streptomyces sp. MBT65]|nr:ATP-binding protein [Streptomyces sp. MBT65]
TRTSAPAPAHSYGSEHDERAVADASGHHAVPDAGGLPRRRRRTPAAAPAVPVAPETRQPERRPEQAAAALGALQSGTAAARAAMDDAETAVEAVTAHETQQTDYEGGAAR